MTQSTQTAKEFFAPARWTAKAIEKNVKEAVQQSADAYKTLARTKPEHATFDTVVMALERASVRTGDVLGMTHLLMNVHPRADVREMAHKMSTWAEAQLIKASRNKGVYDALVAASKKREVLRGDQKKLLKDYVTSYRRMGFDLPEKKQKELVRMEMRLTKLSTQFSQNINTYHDEIIVTPDEVSGLPETFVTQLPKKNGAYVVSLDYPASGPFMEYADDRAKREELWHKLMARGGAKNMKILDEIVALRKDHAKLLGYKTHADYVLEERMAKSGDKAVKFVEDVLKKSAKRSGEDVAALRAHAKTLGIATLMPWDVAYVSNKLQHELHAIDNHAVRAYFPLEHVLEQMMAVYEKFLGVTFARVEGVLMWHKDVQAYAVHDSSGAVQSYFAMDLHPRKDKYGHAAAFDMATGWSEAIEDGEAYHLPAACLVTNFPASTKKHPSLLSHGEVVTLFHEFGHVMHQVLTRAALPSQSGFHVAWDFVETPSQLMEYWAWEPKVLKQITKHYETGKAMPPKMIANLIATDGFNKGYGTTRQMVFSLFDLTLHTKGAKDTAALYGRLVKKYTCITVPKGHMFPAGFGHLMGYDAGYYGYMWTKVFAADLAAHIKQCGMLNPKVGVQYRQTVLEQGSSKDEMQLLKDFLGRMPNTKAFGAELKK